MFYTVKYRRFGVEELDLAKAYAKQQGLRLGVKEHRDDGTIVTVDARCRHGILEGQACAKCEADEAYYKKLVLDTVGFSEGEDAL